MRVAKGVKYSQTSLNVRCSEPQAAAVPLETRQEPGAQPHRNPTDSAVRAYTPCFGKSTSRSKHALASRFRAPHSTRGITRSDPHFTPLCW